MSSRLLVVGAGQAGVQVASSARELGWRGPITLVGAEPAAPYARPPLSKAYLRGSATADSLALRNTAFYAEQDINLVLGEQVDTIDMASDGTGSATTTAGQRRAFDRLVLATGATPRRLPIDGADLDGVLALRDLCDATRLADRLSVVDDVVVVGGGFIGLEVAATATAAGRRVTVVEAAPALLNRVVSPTTARIVEAAHRAAGVRVRTDTRPRRFVGDDGGAVTAVELWDGTRLPADLVLVGVGARANDELARAAGLHCDNGIVVDEYSLASDGRTIAVGDCANLPDPTPLSSPASRLRLESVDNAVEQGRTAATTLVGTRRPYRSVPWFWSDQGGVKLQIAGLGHADDEIVCRSGRRPGQHTVLRYRADRLVAVECVTSPADFLAARKALATGLTLPQQVAADGRRSLREHLATAMK